jgi:tetratricopeptide (TPR) repeat protein
MNITDCYRLLGLTHGASYEQIKAAYRQLARRLHPDVNPGDQQNHAKFIQVTEAYKFLLTVVDPLNPQNPPPPPPPATETTAKPPAKPHTKATFKVTRPDPAKTSPVQANPNLSLAEQHLKLTSYEQLQQLFREQKLPRAIALVEGLAQRLPEDPEVRQWQAITYQRWARHLIEIKQFSKARLYLKKALRTDPHNRSIWAEVERDFRRMEQMW